MHAVVATVNIVQGQFESSRKVLREDVVPQVRQAPGFVKGYWTISADATTGTSLVVFDTKEHAESAAGMARSTATPPGVTLRTVEIREVVAEA